MIKYQIDLRYESVVESLEISRCEFKSKLFQFKIDSVK